MNSWTITLTAALLGLLLGARYRVGALLAASVISSMALLAGVLLHQMRPWFALVALASLQIAYLAGLAAKSAFLSFLRRNGRTRPPSN